MNFSVIEFKKIETFFTLFLFFLCVAANAQTKSIKKTPLLKEASPESVGMSTERLVRIDDMCEQAVSEGHIPSVVALVARH